MSNPSGLDDKQRKVSNSCGSSFFSRAKNRLRMLNVLRHMRKEALPPAVIRTRETRSSGSTTAPIKAEVQPEATMFEVSGASVLRNTAAANDDEQNSPRFPRSTKALGPAETRKIPKIHKWPRSEQVVRRRKKSGAKTNSECTYFSDFEDIEANSEKWKTFASEYAAEHLVHLEAAARTSGHILDNVNEAVLRSSVDEACSPRCGVATREEGSRAAKRYSTVTLSSSGTLSEDTANLLREQNTLAEAAAETPVTCQQKAPCEPRPSLVADGDSVSDKAASREDHELQDKLTSWDPLQEDGYGLSPCAEVFEFVDQERVREPTPNSMQPETSAGVRLPAAAALAPCSRRSVISCCEYSTDHNFYEDLQWITDESEDRSFKSSLGTGVERRHTTAKKRLFNGPAVLAAINCATDSLASMTASPRQTAKLVAECQLTVNASDIGTATLDAVLDVLPISTQQTKPEFPNQHVPLPVLDQAMRQRDDQCAVRRAQPDMRSTVKSRERHRPDHLVESGGNNSKEVPDATPAATVQSNIVGAQIVAKGQTALADEKSENIATVGTWRQSCADSADDRTEAPCSVSSKTAVTGLVGSLCLANVPDQRLLKSLFRRRWPDASWDTAPPTDCARAPGLGISELDKDDVTVGKDNGGINIRIRTSTPQKSAMLWPFGAVSLRQPQPSPRSPKDDVERVGQEVSCDPPVIQGTLTQD